MRNWALVIVAMIGVLAMGTAARADLWYTDPSDDDWSTTDTHWAASEGGAATLGWNNDGTHVAIFKGDVGPGNGKVKLQETINAKGIVIDQDGTGAGVYGITDDEIVNLGSSGLDFTLDSDNGSNQKFQSVNFVLTAGQTWAINQKWRSQGASLDVNGKALSVDILEFDGDYANDNFDVNDTSGTPGTIKIIGGSFQDVDMADFDGLVSVEGGEWVMSDGDAAMSADMDVAFSGGGTLDAGSNEFTVEFLTVDGIGQPAGTYTDSETWLTSGTLHVTDTAGGPGAIIPEPATVTLLVLGIGGVGARLRRRLA
jgi:hypothetical protein